MLCVDDYCTHLCFMYIVPRQCRVSYGSHVLITLVYLYKGSNVKLNVRKACKYPIEGLPGLYQFKFSKLRTYIEMLLSQVGDIVLAKCPSTRKAWQCTILHYE